LYMCVYILNGTYEKFDLGQRNTVYPIHRRQCSLFLENSFKNPEI
jgi:hypothetical protein